MASGKRPSPEQTGARRRREPPTIDLTATEIARAEPEMAKTETAEPTPDPASAAPSPTEPPAAPPPTEAEALRFRFAPDERAPSQPAEAPPRLSESLEASEPVEPPEPPEAEPPRTSAWPPSGAAVGLVAGGAAAGIVVFLLILWIVGPFRSRDDAAMAMNARLAQMELQLRDLAGRPPPAAFDPKPLEELSARLSRIESSLSTRLATAEATAKAASETAALANRRIDETAAVARDARSQADAAASTASRNNPDAARADLEALAGRLAAVEKNAKTTEAELAKRAVAPDDRTGRLAIAALSLRGAVERGDPFGAELAAVKALAADAKVLAPLEPYAASGLPSPSALSRELGKLAPLMQRAAGATSEAGIVEKLQANAERLVRIRPVEDVPGDDPATVIGRIEVKTAQNDIAGALAEMRKLPPAVRAPAEDWTRRAESRNAALESAKSFAATALAALGKAGS